MNSFPRLLCLALLASAAYAQTPAPDFVTSDSSLAGEHPAQMQTAKPSAGVSHADLQTRTPAGQSVLPTATVLRIKLNHPVSTVSARAGQELEATLTRAVEVDGRVVIPAGSRVNCRIESAHGPRRFSGKPALAIKARSVRLPNGDELYFSATIVDTSNPHHLDVDSEGRVHGVTPNPMDKVELGALTGVGAIAGTVIAGPEGLLIGTASGALVAAGHIVVKHRDLTLPAGTELILELDSPASIERPQFGGMQ